MDPLTALALAGNVLQFVDFARNLIKEGKELYRSNSGALKTNEELKMITSDLKALVERFRQSFGWTSVDRADQVEGGNNDTTSLETICAGIANIAEELITKLERLGNKDTNGRPWSTLYQVIKSAWSKEEVAGLVKRLAVFQEAVKTHVLLSIRESLESHALQVSAGFRALDEQNQLILSSLLASSKTSANILTTMAQLASRLEVTYRKDDPENENDDENEDDNPHHLKTRQSILTMLRRHTDNIRRDDMGVRNITAGIEMLDVSSHDELKLKTLVTEDILQGLRYPTMSHRYEGILDAYPETFGWAFQPRQTEQVSSTSISEWLKTGEGVYWISGKAGSGKSTLMKHLLDDSRTRDLLKEWAQISPPGPAPLCLATFFFWNSGSLDQRSQVGMLRSLISQVFTQYPKLIPILIPLRWAKEYSKRLKPDSKSIMEILKDLWSPKQLMEAFISIFRQDQMRLKLCFLIDGFDEFEGDQEDLSQILKSFATAERSGIKICFSSRAWPVFRQCFQGHPTLRLQDLTSIDIETYVREKMCKNNAYNELALRERDSAAELIHATVERAEGVFLWVAIVVKSLLRGITNCDSMSDLWIRLQTFPRELEPLYELLMSQIESIYLIWSSRAFQIVRVSHEMNNNPYGISNVDSCMTPLLLPAFYAAINDDILFDDFQDWDTFEAAISWRRTEIQLEARCAGLLELSTPIGAAGPKSRVQYLHRTARDFLEMKTHWKAILAHTADTKFSPYCSMMKACAITLKLEYWRLSPAYNHLDEIYLIENAAFDFLVCAYNSDSQLTSIKAPIELIQSLHEMTFHGNEKTYHWMNLWWQYLPTPESRSTDFLFLCLAAVFGLTSYVRFRLCKGTAEQSLHTSTSLLRYLQLERNRQPFLKTLPPFKGEMRSLLLEFGGE